MGHLVSLNDIHLICNKDLECSSKVLNSYCDRNSSCVCERGYRYYSKFNKCIFSNRFQCNNVQQCANLDPRLTCNDNYCTCKEKEKRADNYLCSSFRKYCYKGYRYNVETTDCVFVGDLTINNQLENLDQSVEIFVIILFFITSALFILSCINNYKNERAEKLRRRMARQQAISLFAEQRGRIDLNASITEVVNLANENYNGHLRNGPRNSSTRNQNRSQFRHHQNMMNEAYRKFSTYDDLPPSYDEVMRMVKSEDNSKYLYLNPLANNSTEQQQINFVIIEESSNQNSSGDLLNQTGQCLNYCDVADGLNMNHSVSNLSNVNHSNNSEDRNHQTINHLDNNTDRSDTNIIRSDNNMSHSDLNTNHSHNTSHSNNMSHSDLNMNHLDNNSRTSLKLNDICPVRDANKDENCLPMHNNDQTDAK